MIGWFNNWRQKRRTDKLLALIMCRSGHHPDITGGDRPGYCRWCGHDVLAEVVSRVRR